jgi:Tfp pilus assembly protein PilO
MKSYISKYIKVAAMVWSGCFIVFLLAYIFILSPLNKRKTYIEREFRKVKNNAEAALLASQEQTKIRLNKQIEQLNESLGDFVIEPGNISNLTYQISGISNKIGLNAFQVTPIGQNVSIFDDCKYVSGQLYQVGFTASFNQFAAFLNALERYRPVIFIDTFSITRSHEGKTNHTVDMQLAILVAKNEKAKTKVEG